MERNVHDAPWYGDYEKQAQDFLDKHYLSIRAAFKGDKCPPWDDDKHIHGDRYRVTIRRYGPQRASISFDFWNSYNDARNGKRPSAYDVLAMISSEAYAPIDPDEVAAEYDEMKPSQAIAVARFDKRLQAFFTEAELEDLAEIN